MRRINTIIPLQAMGERMEEVCRGIYGSEWNQ